MTKLFFKILVFQLLMFLFINNAKAHVELTYPEGGETFIGNDTVKITWVEAQAHDTQNWELYYSPDAGETWQTISNNIPVSKREYEWMVPNEETSKARIRVVQNNSDLDYDNISANFTVENVTSVHEIDNLEYLFDTFYNYPNPFKQSTTFSFELNKKEHLTLNVYRLDGSLVATIIDNDVNTGEHQIDWNPSPMSAGTYIYTIKIGDAIRTKKLQIVR